MALGRPVEVETLEQRIATRLHEALDQQGKAGILAVSDRGLGVFDDTGADGSCVLRVDDVARIAAAEARAWF